METKNKRLERICGFYVSDWHLATMLLPYINKRLEENIKVITILEESIEDNIKTLLKKLNLNNQEKIAKINWKNINLNEKKKIKEILNKEIKEKTDKIILINGKKDFINECNNKIDKWIESKNLKTKIKIINLFKVTDFNNNIIKILDNHDKILNTSGEKEITEVFEDYHREDIIGK